MASRRDGFWGIKIPGFFCPAGTYGMYVIHFLIEGNEDHMLGIWTDIHVLRWTIDTILAHILSHENSQTIIMQDHTKNFFKAKIVHHRYTWYL